jgi:hypothetical protein
VFEVLYIVFDYEKTLPKVDLSVKTGVILACLCMLFIDVDFCSNK